MQSSFLILLFFACLTLSTGAKALAAVFDYDEYYFQAVYPEINLNVDDDEELARTKLKAYLSPPSRSERDRYVAIRQAIYFSRSRDETLRLMSQIEIKPDDFLTLYLKAKNTAPALSPQTFQTMEQIFEESVHHKEIAKTISTIAYELAFAYIDDKNHIAAIEVLKTGLTLFPANSKNVDKLFLMDAMAAILQDTLNPPDMVRSGIALHDEVEAEFRKAGHRNAADTISMTKGFSRILSLHDFQGALQEFDRIAVDHFTYQEVLLGKSVAYLGLKRHAEALAFYRVAEPDRNRDDSGRTSYLKCIKTLIGFELNVEHSLSPCLYADQSSGKLIDVLFIKRLVVTRPVPAHEQAQIDAKFQSYFFNDMSPRIQHAMASSVNRLSLIRARQEAELAQIMSQNQAQENSFKTALVTVLSLVVLLVVFANLLLKRRNARINELNLYIKTRILQRFLPPTLIDEIVQGKSRIDEIPQQKCITILFCDLVDFTQATESLGSEKTARLLHQYFERMSERIFKTQGTIDKFIGDAIMVIFGAPIDQELPLQVQRSVQCASEMLECLEILNEEWSQEFGVQFAVRIGINSGEAIVGSFGSEMRSDYTVIGSAVNIASRIEQLAKPNSILVSQTTADHIKPERLESMGQVRLRGINQTQELFFVKRDVTTDKTRFDEAG